MDIETYCRNLAFLKKKSLEYPHACRTKIRFPTPDAVKRITGLDFIYAPLMKEAEWRFRTADDMSKFKQNYTTLDNKS